MWAMQALACTHALHSTLLCLQHPRAMAEQHVLWVVAGMQADATSSSDAVSDEGLLELTGEARPGGEPLEEDNPYVAADAALSRWAGGREG